MNTLLRGIFARGVVGRPVAVLLLVLLVVAFFAYQARFFKLDASSDSLVLDNDQDLRYYQLIRRAYTSDDYLIVTFTPKGDMFARKTLADLKTLVEELKGIERVDSVNSILGVPLFHSPKVSLMALAQGFQTLEKPTVDLALARQEMTTSPLFRDFLISEDGRTSAVQINFKKNEDFEALSNRRDDLRFKNATEGLSPPEAEAFVEVERIYNRQKTENAKIWRQDVQAVRDILERHQSEAQLFLGGVPMIVADMVRFVSNDIVVFGLGVLLFLVLALTVIFRDPRWVAFPILTCMLSGLVMIGVLGWRDWRATVISSNFLSLLFIIAMSMAIHLVVRYRELQRNRPEASPRELVLDATSQVAVPCLYCALTTMVGFGSLMVSGIRPVIDFGLMMAVGIGVAFLMCFSFLPGSLALLPKARTPPAVSSEWSLTGVFARFTDRHGNGLLLAVLVLVIFSVAGIRRLTVENRFIDYFKKSTEIYKGMLVIDEQLGGTTPLELILEGEGPDYWFQPEGLARLREIHEFLDGLPETGKVISLDTMIRVIEKINDGNPVNGFILGMVRRFLPEDLKKEILRPYVSEDSSQARISVRVQDSNPDLMREVLLGKIRAYLYDDLQLSRDQARLTGMYVLYNNMLQSLFRSQILTIGMVFLATWIMFVFLFRSVFLASIAIVPNMIPVLLVLGTLGWLGIPLDMMTITIAAITIGIAVDHSIHYIHRFKHEFPKDRDYRATMYRCHASIGKAMYYTSVTIVFGFSILTLSNFIPTIYFGLFTGLAMVTALLAAMTLLPRLLLLLKPLGKEHPKTETVG